jgi:MoCo/4Fe-4S cofactor protein with predicted Tat translocation signal
MKRRIPPSSNSSVRSSQRCQWSSLEELAGDPAFEAWIDAEYPAAAEFAPTARREFLKLMGASFALAGLTGCEKSPFVAALPYVDQPQDVSVGLPKYYATAVMLDGYAQPVIATTYSGRPTKLDGNPDHPVTQGRSDIFMQAAVLGLYDPDRAQGPTRRGEPVSWSDVAGHIDALRGEWARNQGQGLRLLTGSITSPTLQRQLDGLLKQFPQARVHVHEPVGNGWRRGLAAAAYGQPLELHYQLEDCAVVVSFDDDFLGPGPDQVHHARAWSLARRRDANRPGIQLHMAESIPSITGAMAGTRLVADASRMPDLAQAFASKIGVTGATMPDLTSAERKWIDQAAAACRDARGHALIAANAFGHAATAGWAARSNDALGAGALLRLLATMQTIPNAGGLADLVADITAGKVEALVVVDANPAYSAPGSLNLREALQNVRSSLHLGLQRDETGELCEWQLPLTHALESWSDARAVDGTVTIIQPTVAPFYDVRTAHQVVAMLAGQTDLAAEAVVRETWQVKFPDDFETTWRRFLHDGFVQETAAESVTVRASATEIAPPFADDGIDVVFRPDPTVWDGQFANIGWLQELPKPLTTLTWGNVVAVSPALAKRISVANGDHVKVTIRDRSLVGPAWIMPGQAANTVALYLGYGRRRAGRVGDGIGYDAYDLRPVDQPWLTKGSLHKVGTAEVLAVTQLHHRMEGFDFVREVSVEHPALPPPSSQPSLYPAKPPAKNAWGMVIDLDSCIGCNACVVACTAENNVPVVGRDQVKIGREMHWLRIARYYTGEVEAPRSFFQPVPCMHCEDAPCEMGCPVHATTHSPEGVNQMVYNRCIGTRTCSSYCPYKVRRFNFYDYRNAPESPEQAAHNPDVTVRSRGVMEKCTYCTQRIEAAHVAADKENRPLREGEVVTACQSACPTRAITFGDINDPNSEVSRLRREGRHYALLEEQGTRPRTTYLARWNDLPGNQQG